MYAMFHYLRYHGLDVVNNLKKVEVLNTSCTAAPRMASAMMVDFLNKNYSINLPYENCSKYSSGDKVELLYDVDFNNTGAASKTPINQLQRNYYIKK